MVGEVSQRVADDIQYCLLDMTSEPPCNSDHRLPNQLIAPPRVCVVDQHASPRQLRAFSLVTAKPGEQRLLLREHREQYQVMSNALGSQQAFRLLRVNEPLTAAATDDCAIEPLLQGCELPELIQRRTGAFHMKWSSTLHRDVHHGHAHMLVEPMLVVWAGVLSGFRALGTLECLSSSRY